MWKGVMITIITFQRVSVPQIDWQPMVNSPAAEDVLKPASSDAGYCSVSVLWYIFSQPSYANSSDVSPLTNLVFKLK